VAIYWLSLLLIVALAIGVLAAVALAAIGRRNADQTGLSIALRTLMAHLNGDAAAPQVAELLVPAARSAERRVGPGDVQSQTGPAAPGVSDQEAASGAPAKTKRLGSAPAEPPRGRELAA